MLISARICGLIGVVFLLLGIYLMFQYQPEDSGRVPAILLALSGPSLLLLSGWLIQIDKENKYKNRRNQ
jgi:hypothetical protein